jgi:orotate phosphoribosyltransferase
METKKATLAEMLFVCEAVRVAPADSPFLYTSGLVGPYYINTHYLCGGPQKSEEILAKITELGDNPAAIASEVPKLLFETINSFPVYDEIVQRLAEVARPLISQNDISFISGGQRRDWFFSVPLARTLSLPHVYIFNNLSLYDDAGNVFSNTEPAKSLHVADLLSVGSSYLSKWILALESVNIKIAGALNCVDRNQGGKENLLEAGIPEVQALCSINEELFTDAFEKGILTRDQLTQVLDFIKDPFSTMKKFIQSNPGFITRTLSSDPKSQARIKKTLNDDLYKLGEGFLRHFNF